MTQQNLDGKTPIVVTPYDAHEQIVRAPHTHSPEDGYQPVVVAVDSEEAPVQEFPKAVDHVKGEPVVVASAEEEAAFNDAKAAKDSDEAKPEPAVDPVPVVVVPAALAETK